MQMPLRPVTCPRGCKPCARWIPGIPQSSSSSLSSDRTLESRGALAGLQGVLPAVPGFNPTSKPKAYSIKLQASEEQQAHAALLEQILAAETEPVPLTSFSALANSRGLRWLLAIILFVSSISCFITSHSDICHACRHAI